MLPADFPNWRTWYFRRERPGPGQDSILEQSRLARPGKAMDGKTTRVDSQSVKNTDSADSKGYERARRCPASRWRSPQDKRAFADVTDRAGALMFDENRADLSVQVLVDGGLPGSPAAAVQMKLKRNERNFVVLPKRWVVERSFAWLEKCRRLSVKGRPANGGACLHGANKRL